MVRRRPQGDGSASGLVFPQPFWPLPRLGLPRDAAAGQRLNESVLNGCGVFALGGGAE
jgi:hypothetical protein